MFDAITALLATANAIQPLGVIALLAVVIYKQVNATRQVSTITDNHLHDMPEILETLQRMERTMAALDSYLRARLNGGPRV